LGRYNSYGEIIGAIGIITTPVCLSIQIRENSKVPHTLVGL